MRTTRHLWTLALSLTGSLAILSSAGCEGGSDDPGNPSGGAENRGGATDSAGTATFGGQPLGGGGTSAGASFGGGPLGGSTPEGSGGDGAIGGDAGGGSGDCFDPIVHPELALDPAAQGCPCSFGASCVTVEARGESHALAIVCEDGQWQNVEDGPCWPTVPRQASCKVLGRTYSSGSTYVPDPHSCNICSCEDGTLVCTDESCPTECPPNGAPGRRSPRRARR